MFCTKCGCRIPSNASKCTNCGAELSSMEYCGGFWSELNQNSLARNYPAFKVEHQEQNQNAETAATGHDQRAGQTTNKDGKEKIIRSLLKYAVIAEGAIILILLIYTTVSGAGLREKIEELNNTIEEAGTNYTKLENDRVALEGKLEKEKQNLEDQNRYLNSRNSELERENKGYIGKIESLETEIERLNLEIESLRNGQEHEQAGSADDQEQSLSGEEAAEPNVISEVVDNGSISNEDAAIEKDDRKTNDKQSGLFFKKQPQFIEEKPDLGH